MSLSRQIAERHGIPLVRCGHCGGHGTVPLSPELHRVLSCLTDEPQTAQEVHEAMFGAAAARVFPGLAGDKGVEWKCKSKVQTEAATLAQLQLLCALGLASLLPERRVRKGTRPAYQFVRAVTSPPPPNPDPA